MQYHYAGIVTIVVWRFTGEEGAPHSSVVVWLLPVYNGSGTSRHLDEPPGCQLIAGHLLAPSSGIEWEQASVNISYCPALHLPYLKPRAGGQSAILCWTLPLSSLFVSVFTSVISFNCSCHSFIVVLGTGPDPFVERLCSCACLTR